MKTFSVAAVLSIIIFLIACQSDEAPVQEQQMPELEIFDYYEDDIPFQKLVASFSPNEDEEASLGRILFYDTRLSYNNSISCGSCHVQTRAFSDNKQFNPGLYNKLTPRNTISIANTGYHTSIFWEGIRDNLEHLILSAVSNHIEMGMRDEEALVEKLKTIEEYNVMFENIFNSEINESNVKKALNSFVSALISYNSKYDAGLEKDFTNFSAAELKGKDLFFGKAKCVHCHRGDHMASQWRLHTNIGLDLEYADQGAGDGRFKIPSLRNIELTAPYMHDGRFETLEEVVEHYTEGIKDHPHLDWALDQKISLTDNEKGDLIIFLKTLTDYKFISDPKFSDPF